MEGYHRIAGGEQRATLLETERAWLAATKVTLRVPIGVEACTRRSWKFRRKGHPPEYTLHAK